MVDWGISLDVTNWSLKYFLFPIYGISYSCVEFMVYLSYGI